MTMISGLGDGEQSVNGKLPRLQLGVGVGVGSLFGGGQG
jgi:hypothetical protein